MRTFRNNPELLNLFFLAETLGKTVDELLLGRPAPLSDIEFEYWPAYFSFKREQEEKASKANSKDKKDDSLNTNVKKTMGPRQ